MLWEVEIRPLGRDGERERVCDEFDLLTHAERGGDLVTASARGFLLEGDLGDADLERLAERAAGRSARRDRRRRAPVGTQARATATPCCSSPA